MVSIGYITKYIHRIGRTKANDFSQAYKYHEERHLHVMCKYYAYITYINTWNLMNL